MSPDRSKALRLLPPRVKCYVALLADANISEIRELRRCERETRSMLPRMTDDEMELAHRLLRRMDAEDMAESA